MHFSMLLSYLSVIAAGFIFTVTETQARPYDGRSTSSSSSPAASPPSTPGIVVPTLSSTEVDAFIAFAEVNAMLSENIVNIILGPEVSGQLVNATIPNFKAQMALAINQLQLVSGAITELLNKTEELQSVFGNGCLAFTGNLNLTNSADALAFMSSASSAAVRGISAIIMEKSQVVPLFSNLIFDSMAVISNIQALASQQAFGLASGLLDGLIAPIMTPAEADLALQPIKGNCSVNLDFTGQTASFASIPQVPILSETGEQLVVPIFVANGTNVSIDTTQLRASDNCTSPSNLSCQVITLQDLNPQLDPLIIVSPIESCEVAADGPALIYITSDNTPLPTNFDERLTMSTDTICAGPTLVYVNSVLALL